MSAAVDVKSLDPPTIETDVKPSLLSEIDLELSSLNEIEVKPSNSPPTPPPKKHALFASMNLSEILSTKKMSDDQKISVLLSRYNYVANHSKHVSLFGCLKTFNQTILVREF